MSVFGFSDLAFMGAVGTPSGPIDPFFSSVSLLLHGDGANGSTTITDSSPTPRTVTAVGDAQISTAQSRFGGASIALDGSGDYLDISSLETDLLSGDFTVEGWVYRGSSSNQTFFNSFPHNTLSVNINRENSGKTALYIGNGSTWLTLDFRSSGTISANTWTHLAVVRSNNAITIYHNGVNQGTTSTNMPTGFGGAARIGGITAGGGSEWFNGYMDDLRITKGVARYTSNFTPPTAPFPDV